MFYWISQNVFITEKCKRCQQAHLDTADSTEVIDYFVTFWCGNSHYNIGMLHTKSTCQKERNPMVFSKLWNSISVFSVVTFSWIPQKYSLQIGERYQLVFETSDSTEVVVNFYKKKVLNGSVKLKYFQVQKNFHHDKQHGFIRSVEMLYLPNTVQIANSISVVWFVVNGMPHR